MKLFFLLTLIIWTSSNIYSQDELFKKVKFTDSTRLICVTDHLDSIQVNKRFSFYCQIGTQVKDILNTFKVGKKVREIGEGNEIHIYILKGQEVQPIQILINPRYENVNTDVLGDFEYYSFDTTQLVKAHAKYPISYQAKWLTFDTQKEFSDFISIHQADTSLLCYEDNTLEYVGTGKILIQKDNVVPDGFKGTSYIEHLLKKVTNKEEYSVGFLPTEDRQVFTFEVQCSKELYDKLADKRCIKKGWTNNKFELLTYWRK
jgi:hypothetical protein